MFLSKEFVELKRLIKPKDAGKAISGKDSLQQTAYREMTAYS